MEGFLLSFVRSNSSLRSYFEEHVAPRSIRSRRSNAGICVIDDEPFAPQQNLRNYGYNITALGDIKDVEEVLPFDVVLCDLMGVGQHLDKTLQGASLIAEIRRMFPEKYVVAYTSAAMSATIARQATSMSDEILRKDIEMEDWVSVLDRYTDLVQNPFLVWQRIRSSLVYKGIDTKNILLLESAYVSSVERRDSSFSRLRAVSKSLNIHNDVRAVINGVIGSIAFKYVFGG